MNAIIIFCAKYLIFFLTLLAIGYWATLPKKQKVQVVVFGIITGVVAVILAKIGSMLFYDSRPFVIDHVVPLFTHGNDNGFPSDHMLLSSVIAVTIFSASKKWGWSLLVLALLVGGGRVLAHVHRPLDILASLIFALIGGVVAYQLTPTITVRLLKEERSRRKPEL